MSHLLLDAAQKEGLSPRLCVKALRAKLWGGTPEAMALASVFGICISVQTQCGRTIFRIGSGEECYLGLAANHYVVLKPRTLSQGAPLNGSARGGAYRSHDDRQIYFANAVHRCFDMRHILVRSMSGALLRRFFIPTCADDTVGLLRASIASRAQVEAGMVELADPTGIWLPDWSPLPRSGRLEATLTIGDDSDSDISEAPYEATL